MKQNSSLESTWKLTVEDAFEPQAWDIGLDCVLVPDTHCIVTGTNRSEDLRACGIALHARTISIA